jgi:hypothetical protein
VAVARGFAASSIRAVDAVADALQSFMVLVTCTHVDAATDWRMQASKRAQGFATLAGLEKSGCVSAAAQTCAHPFPKSREGCTDPPIIALAHVVKPQIG